MATKSELLEKAKLLGLEVTDKNTVVEITAAIKNAETVVADEPVVETETTEQEAHTTKAGKYSAKAKREAEEAEAKEARKAAGDTSPVDPDAETTKRGPRPITRPLIERRGRKYRELAKQIDSSKSYSLNDALELATKTSPAKFDASVEVHIVLGVDPRQADQNIRATVTLPHGSGKSVRVAAFVPDEQAKAALEAGATVAGEEAIIAMLEKQQLDFDILVSTPQLMPKLGKYARVLGPRGLMPNPKSGTVSANPSAAVKESMGGRIEYRVDKQSIVHLAIGKVSFGPEKLIQNARACIDSLQAAKPSSLKGNYIRAAHASTTMGPGIRIDVSSF